MKVKELIEKLKLVENQDLKVEIDLTLYDDLHRIKHPISVPARAEYVVVEEDAVYISSDLNWYVDGEIVATSKPL